MYKVKTYAIFAWCTFYRNTRQGNFIFMFQMSCGFTVQAFNHYTIEFNPKSPFYLSINIKNNNNSK